MRPPQTYLTGQRVPRSADYVCNMCGARQSFREGEIFGPCGVCGEHARAWTLAQEKRPRHSSQRKPAMTGWDGGSNREETDS
jgi:hypothetical protein